MAPTGGSALVDATAPTGASCLLDGTAPTGRSSLVRGMAPTSGSGVVRSAAPTGGAGLVDAAAPTGGSSLVDTTAPTGASCLLGGTAPTGGSGTVRGMAPTGGLMPSAADALARAGDLAAHALRNALGVLRLRLQIQQAAGRTAASDVSALLVDLDRAARAERLLACARPQRPLRTVDLAEVLREVAASARTEADLAGLRMDLRLVDRQLPVGADRPALSLALRVLLGRAVGGLGGTLAVTVRLARGGVVADGVPAGDPPAGTGRPRLWPAERSDLAEAERLLVEGVIGLAGGSLRLGETGGEPALRLWLPLARADLRAG